MITLTVINFYIPKAIGSSQVKAVADVVVWIISSYAVIIKYAASFKQHSFASVCLSHIHIQYLYMLTKERWTDDWTVENCPMRTLPKAMAH